MSFLSRGTRAAARPAQRVMFRQRQPRRNASDHHDSGHGSSESAYHLDGGASTNGESFGKGFYIALMAVPFAYIAYSVSSTQDNFVKRSYRDYWASVDKVGRQDVLHAAALEQAIGDRSTMYSEPRIATRDIRYPELFNHGSPWNVVAGEGTADLRKLEGYYQEQQKRIDEERAAKASARKS